MLIQPVLVTQMHLGWRYSEIQSSMLMAISRSLDRLTITAFLIMAPAMESYSGLEIPAFIFVLTAAL